MKVFLLKDIEHIGLSGEIVKVKEGFAQNYLLPRKMGVEVTKSNQKHFNNRERVVDHRKEVLESKSSMLAEKIKSARITLKRKTHNDGKLYGSISPQELVDLLGKKGISISKSQILFGKSIKIGEREKNGIQHSGLGRKLMSEAEKISGEDFDAKKLLVISAVGTREYYKKLGYSLDGPYMSKQLR